MAKAAMNKIWWMMFSPINMAGMAKPGYAKVRVRVIVMVWLEGGQGDVSGACPPPPPPPPQGANHQGLVPPPSPHPKLPHLDPPDPQIGPRLAIT